MVELAMISLLFMLKTVNYREVILMQQWKQTVEVLDYKHT